MISVVRARRGYCVAGNDVSLHASVVAVRVPRVASGVDAEARGDVTDTDGEALLRPFNPRPCGVVGVADVPRQCRRSCGKRDAHRPDNTAVPDAFDFEVIHRS